MSIYVIAEAGINHNGSMLEAYRLINAASHCGADAVKFQLFDADKLGRPEIRKWQLSREQMAEIKAYAAPSGLEFLCTPFDPESLWWLVNQCVKRLKIGSGGIFNKPLLRAAEESRLPVILSTGMADLKEIEQAMRCLHYAKDVTLLHCVSSYPLAPEDANLGAIRALANAFGVPVGYSDHSANADVLCTAAALGARTIEAHLTLDRSAEGPDHLSSFEPDGFKEAVKRLRRIPAMMGDGRKRAQLCEVETRKAWAHD